MVDPLTAVGSAASIFQLVGSISKGLRSLRDTVIAIKDAPALVKKIDEKIHLLEDYFILVDNIMKQKPSGIPDELELHRVIRDLTINCHSSLSVLQQKLLPTRNAQNMVQAFHLWVDDRTIKQALNHIDEYTNHLLLLIEALNLFKLDDVDKRLRWIADFLKEAIQPRQSIQEAPLSEDDRKALETVRKVRAFANNAATTFVSFQAVDLSSLSTSRSRAPLSTNAPNTIITVSPGPSRKRKLREVEYELAENRKILTRLKIFGLYEGAVGIQKRAFDLKGELAMDHDVSFHDEEKDCMKEELADLLTQCSTESSTDEALSILQELLHPVLANQENATEGSLLVPLTSAPSSQRKLSLHYKLGQLYKDIGRLDKAMDNLRIVFDAYTEENPKDTQKIKQVGERLLGLYEHRVQYGGAGLRGVFVSQLQGFRSELEEMTGRPLEHRSQCDAALDWCREKKISVPEEHRFDIIDDDGSSPLHCAAQKCHKASVICQMLENSDTLENKDHNGDTPLLAAVESSNVTALTCILQKGGSLSARGNQRQTALHRSQKSEVTRLLLQHRIRRASTATADFIDQARRDSSSSLTATVSPASPVPGQDLDIDAQDATKKTALYMACAQGREMTVNLLLLAGADPNIARHNHSPLAAAIESKSKIYQDNPQRQVNVVAALVNKGANPEAVRNLRELQRPRGKFREIRKALEGRAGALPLSLSNRTLELWDSSSDRTSVERTSLSSSSAIGIRLELTDMGPSSLADFINSDT